MGRQKRNKPRRERTAPSVTHEPSRSLPGWPKSHADAELTGPDDEECVRVTIHGVEHLLHATTARGLSDALLTVLAAYNGSIRAELADPKARKLHEMMLEAMTVPGAPKLTTDDLIV